MVYHGHANDDRDRDGAPPVGACVMIVDGRGRLIGVSPAAQALLAADEGLGLRGGTVRASRCADTVTLDAALLRAGRAVGAVCAAIGTATDDGTVDLVLTLLDAGDAGGETRIAIVAHTVGAAVDRAAVAAARYGLTGAESRVLALLCKGCALTRVAETLAIAPTTVRTHLQRIFDKTEARRQSEVVRLVLTDIDRPRGTA